MSHLTTVTYIYVLGGNGSLALAGRIAGQWRVAVASAEGWTEHKIRGAQRRPFVSGCRRSLTATIQPRPPVHRGVTPTALW
jgi:hypothetical protein